MMEHAPGSISSSPQPFIPGSPLLNQISEPSSKSPIEDHEHFANSDLNRGGSTTPCYYSGSSFDLDSFLQNPTPPFPSDLPSSFNLESNCTEKIPSCDTTIGDKKQGSETNRRSNTGQTSEGDLDHSTQVQMYMGARVPVNTKKANFVAFRVFGRFILKQFLEENPEELSEDHFFKVRQLVFGDSNGHYLRSGFTDWNSGHLKKIRYFLIEFAVHHRTITGDQVKPSTMKGYLVGLQRFFKSEWKYDLNFFKGEIFACPNEGLVAVLDNLFSEEQQNGMVITSHNVLSKKDIRKLYSSESLSKATPHGFQARLIFGLSLVTAMRPLALVTLSMNQVRLIQRNGHEVWSINGVIGSRIGASKTAQGGLNAVRDRPSEVFVWNKWAFDGSVNVFVDIKYYMMIRKNIDTRTDRFFLSANHSGKTRKDFLKRQHLGRNSFSRIIRNVCKTEGISGTGYAKGVTAHGLRGTVVTMLFEAGFSDVNVAMKTGHRDLLSLKNYHNLRGDLGKMQQDAIFSEERPKKKSKMQEDFTSKEDVEICPKSSL